MKQAKKPSLKKPSLKKRARLILSRSKLQAKLQVKSPAILRARLRVTNLSAIIVPCLRLAQVRLSGLKLFKLKAFARLAKTRALITARDGLQTQLHYHLHLGDNRLGGKRLGGKRLGGNRLGKRPSRYLTHHLTHYATQKLASLGMAQSLSGGNAPQQYDRQDNLANYLPKLQAKMGMVSAKHQHVPPQHNAPLRADSQYIDRIIRKIIHVKNQHARHYPHPKMIGRLADGDGRHHATENMLGQQAPQAQSLQQIVRQEINPLKAEFKAQLQDLMRGQKTIQQYQQQHAEDGFFSDGVSKARYYSRD